MSGEKVKDAEVLLQNKRYAGSVYLMGYALELGLKRKICQTLGFTYGFPESRDDFSSYNTQIANFNTRSWAFLTQLKQIKSHDLNDLLTYSGVRSTVLTTYQSAWFSVKSWTPESRYIKQYISIKKADSFVTSAKQILKQIV